jgi:undecaprenyl-diphosphatase
MAIATHKILVPHLKEKKAWKIALSCFAVIYFSFLLIGTLIRVYSPNFDRDLLILLNPDEYVIVLDELMVLITDFSLFFGGLAMIWALIAFSIIHKKPEKKNEVYKLNLMIGGIVSIIFLIMSITNAWGRVYNISTYILAPLMMLLFLYIGHLIQTRTEEELGNYRSVLFVITIAALINVILVDGLIKYSVMRPRPLQDANSDWNGLLRTVADEMVRSGMSFPSGHSSGLFVILTPLMYYSDKRYKKILLFSAAAIHAFSRVYLAAHFPLDILFGSLSGFLIASVVYKVLFREERKN